MIASQAHDINSSLPATQAKQPELNAMAAGLGDKRDAPEIVSALLAQTFQLGASDMHLLPTEDGLRVYWRIDGVLQLAGELPKELAPNVVTRMKVLAGLLTYETQTPQEGRLKTLSAAQPVRISTFPTLFGEKLVARVLQDSSTELGRLADLGMPDEADTALSRALVQTSGALVIVGPAGSGKTTTAYAVIREIIARSQGTRSIASLEDPVEVVLPGVAQSQAAEHAGFDMHTGLRALVRQDPEVILIGEIRDAETARVAYQAALTGQLVVTTFHAADAATATQRLIDMGLPPYVVRGATRAIVAQRLMRRACNCAGEAQTDACPACRGTGYRGRQVIAEAADFSQTTIAETVEQPFDRHRMQQALKEVGARDLRSQAQQLVDAGVTTQLELERVLGV